MTQSYIVYPNHFYIFGKKWENIDLFINVYFFPNYVMKQIFCFTAVCHEPVFHFPATKRILAFKFLLNVLV